MMNSLLHLPSNQNPLKFTLEGTRTKVYRNSKEGIVFGIWVNMVYNRHNTPEGISLSGRGDSSTISPQEFVEIQGRAFHFNLGAGGGRDRIQASCTQI